MENLEEKVMDSFRKKANHLLEETINYVYSDLSTSDRSLLIQHLKTNKKKELANVAEVMSEGASYMVAKWLLCTEMLKSRLLEDEDFRVDDSLN